MTPKLERASLATLRSGPAAGWVMPTWREVCSGMEIRVRILPHY